MNLYVQKFTVRHNGKRYKAGEVIENVPDDIGKNLVDNSNGTIVELPQLKSQEIFKQPQSTLDSVTKKDDDLEDESKKVIKSEEKKDNESGDNDDEDPEGEEKETDSHEEHEDNDQMTELPSADLTATVKPAAKTKKTKAEK